MEQVSPQSHPTLYAVQNGGIWVVYSSVVHSVKIIIQIIEKQVNIFVFIVHL